MTLEGSVVHVSLHPEQAPSKCIASFAVGPPVLVDFSNDSIRSVPALVMGKTCSSTKNLSMHDYMRILSTMSNIDKHG